MEITITQSVKDALIADALRIAQHRGYTNLVNGLQPVEDYEQDGKMQRGLQSKYQHEWLEFREALATKSRLHWLHEASDLYYYANQLERQTGQYCSPSTLASLHTYGLDGEQIERAALAKYNWRAEKPGNKDEAYELRLIEQAII